MSLCPSESCRPPCVMRPSLPQDPRNSPCVKHGVFCGARSPTRYHDGLRSTNRARCTVNPFDLKIVTQLYVLFYKPKRPLHSRTYSMHANNNSSRPNQSLRVVPSSLNDQATERRVSSYPCPSEAPSTRQRPPTAAAASISPSPTARDQALYMHTHPSQPLYFQGNA